MWKGAVLTERVREREADTHLGNKSRVGDPFSEVDKISQIDKHVPRGNARCERLDTDQAGGITNGHQTNHAVKAHAPTFSESPQHRGAGGSNECLCSRARKIVFRLRPGTAVGMGSLHPLTCCWSIPMDGENSDARR